MHHLPFFHFRKETRQFSEKCLLQSCAAYVADEIYFKFYATSKKEGRAFGPAFFFVAELIAAVSS